MMLTRRKHRCLWLYESSCKISYNSVHLLGRKHCACEKYGFLWVNQTYTFLTLSNMPDLVALVYCKNDQSRVFDRKFCPFQGTHPVGID